jgi:hypothetical protein
VTRSPTTSPSAKDLGSQSTCVRVPPDIEAMDKR